MISSLMLTVHGVSGLVTLQVELVLKDMSVILMVTYRYVCVVCVCALSPKIKMAAVVPGVQRDIGSSLYAMITFINSNENTGETYVIVVA